MENRKLNKKATGIEKLDVLAGQDGPRKLILEIVVTAHRHWNGFQIF